MQLNDWYQKGMDFQTYVSQMTRNKEQMTSIYERLELSEEQKKKAQALKNVKLRAIGITEDWCGDAMVNNPVLMKIAEEANMNVHFLLRDENLELMDQYLTNGRARSIPKYVFIDELGNEYAVWGPRADAVQNFVDEERAKLPAQDAPDFSEKQKEMFQKLTNWFTEDESLWSKIADSILDTLHKN